TYGTRPEELAYVKSFGLRDMCDNVLELPAHIPSITTPPLFPVDACDHIQIVRITQLVCSNQTWTHHVGRIKIFAFGWAQHTAHLLGLGITGTDVVEDGVTKDMLARIFTLDILALPADVAAELELEIQRLADGRRDELAMLGCHGEPVEVVVDRLAIAGINTPVSRAGLHRLECRRRVRSAHSAQSACGSKRLAQMQLEACTVALLWRRLNGRTR